VKKNTGENPTVKIYKKQVLSEIVDKNKMILMNRLFQKKFLNIKNISTFAPPNY
jgi:hypothetical protein